MTVTSRPAALLGLLALTLIGTTPAAAQTTPVVGSANPATAAPPVPVPHTTPIRVPLFTDLTFTDFSNKTFTYTPPAGGGPWAKVVLAADFSVTAGRQFDRTAQITLGNTNIYYGTTAEPSATVSPAWHVERDLTDYSALFKTAQTGQVILGNIVNGTYTGIIHGSAALLFYPADRESPAPETPDVVLPLPNAPGGAVALVSGSNALTGMFTFPTNVVRAYLDVIAQSQIGDEFWYLGVPDSLAPTLDTSGGTAFRETEVTVDGRPAGVAPVYPWIYTGGIDPYLWRPIPGVQALNFVPYRVDLTPFAATLDDGQPHQVSLRVFNASNYFLVTGALLLYRDPFLSQVTGAVTEDTLSADPDPVVAQNLVTGADGAITGPVSVTSSRRFTISGYVQTSYGRIETEVNQHVHFASRQQFNVAPPGPAAPTREIQTTRQTSMLSSTTTTRDGFFSLEWHKDLSFPLSIDYAYLVNTDGTSSQATKIHQGYREQETVALNGFPFYYRALSDEVSPTDTLLFSAAGSVTGRQGQKSAETYTYFDTLGNTYRRKIIAAAGVLTSVTDGW